MEFVFKSLPSFWENVSFYIGFGNKISNIWDTEALKIF